MKETYPVYFKITFILVSVFLFFAMLVIAKVVLVPLAISILLAIIAYPVYKGFRKLRLPNVLAILCSILLLFIAVAGIIYLIIMQFVAITADFQILLDRFEVIFLNVQEYLEDHLDLEPSIQIEYFRSMANNFMDTGVGGVLSDTLSKAGSVLVAVGVIPIYTFLFLYYRKLFKDVLMRLTPKVKNAKIDNIFLKASLAIQSYMGGIVTVIVILAFFNTLVLYLIGINYALFFGIISAFLTIIPYFGTFIGIALPVTYAIINYDDPTIPIVVLICMNAIQYIEGHFLTPKLIRFNINLNPVAIIVALFLGWMIWGAAGMVMAVPYLAMLKIFLESFEKLKPFARVISGVKNTDNTTSL